MNTTSRKISQGFAGLIRKVPVLLLTTLLAACGGGGGGSDNGGGGSSSSSSGGSSSGGSSSSGSSSSSGGSSSSSSGGGETAPGQPILTMKPQAIKTFQFNWEPVSGASEYRLLENPDGVSGYEQIASFDGETGEYGLVVFLPERVNASYILQACNSVGCTDSAAVAVSGNLAEAVGYIKASNAGTGDNFGSYGALALSADGATLVVGAPSEGNSATGESADKWDDSGAVYVFTHSNGIWQQQAYLKASNAELDDRFGSNLALSADGATLAVSAPYEDSSATGVDGIEVDNNDADSGAAYVFTRDNDTWQQQAYLKASNTDAGDRFGSAISLSGDGTTLAVGTTREASGATGIDGDATDNSAGFSGAAYVFTRDNDTWQQQAYMKASNSIQGMGFGGSLALSADGNTLAVGAGHYSTGEMPHSGIAFTFTRDNGTWQEQSFLTASYPDTHDRFGDSLALSADGTTLAVGAPYENSIGTGVNSGQERFDTSIDSGAVYLFTLADGTWQQQAFIKASNNDAEDFFGSAVALSADGARLAVTAAGEGSAAVGIGGDQTDNSANFNGAAYLFVHENGEWRQESYLKASNTGADDWFGSSVAMSADGDLLAVGASWEDSSATGIGGDQADNSAEDSGAVYLY
ncbi:FG-GAP repeat protein [Microbulbifer taiwanensis]|uniref:Histidine kinase n=1 Tax=Microbulbifer taiwanensis TaxID=986746 RepID=A0ABW1YQM9_9GAMM|nr:integrin [Microbulbifer taiwanensis]